MGLWGSQGWLGMGIVGWGRCGSSADAGQVQVGGSVWSLRMGFLPRLVVLLA